jgi:choline kinase
MVPTDGEGGSLSRSRWRRAVILAAGRGVRLRPATDQIPKPLVSVFGASILERQIELLEQVGVREVLLVTGYRGEMLERAVETRQSSIQFHFRRNPDWASTNSAISLSLASEFLQGGGYILEGDGVFRMSASLQIRDGAEHFEGEVLWVAAQLREPIDGCVLETDGQARLTGIRIVRAAELRPGQPFLKSAGLVLVSSGGAAKLFELVNRNREAYRTKYYDLVFADHLSRWDARVCPISGDDWAEVDTLEDLRRAEELFR